MGEGRVWQNKKREEKSFHVVLALILNIFSIVSDSSFQKCGIQCGAVVKTIVLFCFHLKTVFSKLQKNYTKCFFHLFYINYQTPPEVHFPDFIDNSPSLNHHETQSYGVVAASTSRINSKILVTSCLQVQP